jgi:uncharacterized membrane protein
MDRKALKTSAKITLKKHYWLMVIVCLFAAFLGAEYGSSLMAVNFSDDTSSSVGVDSQNPDATPSSSTDDLLFDLWSGDETAARRQVDANQRAITDHDTIAELGRTRGVFSSMLNSFASGSFVISLADATTSIVRSQSVAVSLMVVVALMVSIAVGLFIVQTYRVVLRRIALEARIYEKVPLRRFLYPLATGRWVRIAWTMLVTGFYSMMWWFTVVGGIIKTYSYFLVPYIVAENPNIRANEAVTLSRRMMKGHKWECFVAQLSFFGWYLLSGITFGLSGIFYSNGYQASFFAEYYARLRALAKERGIEGTAMLSDDYLYAKPSAELLAGTYADAAGAVAMVRANGATVVKPTGFTGWLSDWFGITLRQNSTVDAWQTHEADLDNIGKGEDLLHGITYPGRLAPASMEFRLPKRTNLNPMRSYTLLNLVMMFFIFCFAGWFWEVTLALITEGMFVNRGTLHGPWLPIYGTGGIIILILLKKFRDRPALLFTGTVLLCGCLEYFSSWYLEATHDGQRWWDYTGYFLNLNGRICAEGLLTFGLGGLAIVYLLAPALDNLLRGANRRIMAAVAIVLLVAYIGDQAYSSVVPNTGAGVTDYKGSGQLE